jgi:hypothetical protein
MRERGGGRRGSCVLSLSLLLIIDKARAKDKDSLVQSIFRAAKEKKIKKKHFVVSHLSCSSRVV